MKKLLLSFLLALLPLFFYAQALPMKVVAQPPVVDSTTWLLATTGTTSTANTSLGTGGPVRLSNISDGIVSIDAGFSGRIYLFTGVTDSTSIPTAASELSTTLNLRYDFMEITYFNAPGDCADLSSVDQFGITLSMETIGSNGSSVGYMVNADTLVSAMQHLAPGAVMRDGSGNFLRVASPLHTPVGTYTDMKAYVDELCQNGDTLSFFGMYDGAAAVYIIDSTVSVMNIQNGDTTYTDTTYVLQRKKTYGAIPFYYRAALSASADTIILKPDTLVAGNAGFLQGEIRFRKADLYNTDNHMIYACDGPFTVHPKTLVPLLPDTVPDRVGFNDPWSSVMRDFLVGFNAGYYGIHDTIPVPGSAAGYVLNGNNSWDWNPLDAFSGSYYNTYARYIQQHSDSYGFPFSDFLAKPLLNVVSSDTLLLNIWPDSTTNFSDYIDPYSSLTADTINPVKGNNPTSGNYLVLDFGQGTAMNYNGKVRFLGRNYSCGYIYTLTASPVDSNTTLPGGVTFTGFPYWSDSVNQYTIIVEGKPVNLWIQADANGNFIQAATDNPSIAVTLQSGSVKLSNLAYVINPAGIFAQSAPSASKAKKKPGRGKSGKGQKKK